MQFTLSGLTPGSIYKIANLAKNVIGNSVLSEYVMIGATTLPVAPAQIYKVAELSSKTALTVSWDKSADPSLPITGYLLKVTKFGSKDYQTIFDGANLPTQTQFTYNGVITGSMYTFIVIALNYNGQS